MHQYKGFHAGLVFWHLNFFSFFSFFQQSIFVQKHSIKHSSYQAEFLKSVVAGNHVPANFSLVCANFCLLNAKLHKLTLSIIFLCFCKFLKIKIFINLFFQITKNLVVAMLENYCFWPEVSIQHCLRIQGGGVWTNRHIHRQDIGRVKTLQTVWTLRKIYGGLNEMCNAKHCIPDILDTSFNGVFLTVQLI